MANYNIKIAHFKSINIKSKKVRNQLKPILKQVKKRNKPIKKGKVKKGIVTDYSAALNQAANKLMRRKNFVVQMYGQGKKITKNQAKEMILDTMKYYGAPTEMIAVENITNMLSAFHSEKQARAILNNIRDKTPGTIQRFQKWLKTNKKPELTMEQNFALWRAEVRNDTGQQLIKILLDTNAVTFNDSGTLHWKITVDDIMFESALYEDLYALLKADHMLRVDYVYGSGN